MAKKDISSMRSTLEFLKEENEVLTVKGEVDPTYEIAGIQKALEGGPALLFENIKGYPGVRNVGNVFATTDRIAKIFGVEDPKKMKFRCLEGIKNPIRPRVVDDAPCQEVVITENIDVPATMPILKHTELDAGRILGGGNNFVSGKISAVAHIFPLIEHIFEARTGRASWPARRPTLVSCLYRPSERSQSQVL